MSRRPIGLSVPYRHVNVKPKFKLLTVSERTKFAKRILDKAYVHPHDIVEDIEKLLMERNK